MQNTVYATIALCLGRINTLDENVDGLKASSTGQRRSDARISIGTFAALMRMHYENAYFCKNSTIVQNFVDYFHVRYLKMLYLPARLLWSIMGCTILRLALMNLQSQSTWNKLETSQHLVYRIKICPSLLNSSAMLFVLSKQKRIK